TLANAVLFRGLPFEDPDRVLYLSSNNNSRNQTDIGVSYADFRDWREQSKSFQAMGAYSTNAVVVIDDVGSPERYVDPRLTANTFSLIGQKPLLGRDFLPGEDKAGATPVCIIGYSIWENRYGRDPNGRGKSIRMNDEATTIVGVMPPKMKFPVNGDLWTPLIPGAEFEKRDARNMQAFGRLNRHATLAQARSELESIAQRLAKAFPKTNEG